SDEEPVGAQGISLTPGRSIAVDRKLHTYGTPFFITAMLPIEGEQPTTPFRRLMIAQDTGGAIVGPARGDIYFGAGAEAGSISGRLRHPGRFVMLLPRALDPATIKGPVPLPRPKPDMVVAARDTTPHADKAEADTGAGNPSAIVPLAGRSPRLAPRTDGSRSIKPSVERSTKGSTKPSRKTTNKRLR